MFLDRLCRTWLSAGNQLLRWHLLLNAMHDEIKQMFEHLTCITVLEVLEAYAISHQWAAFQVCNQLQACVSCR